MSLKLYTGTRNASSWAMRAWLALKEAGLEFEEELVDIRRPQRYANLEALGSWSAQRTIPVLRLGDVVISDSLAIMELANDLTGGTLLPHDVVIRAQARALLAWQHAGLSNICSRISFESAFYLHKRAFTEQENIESERLAVHLDGLLSRFEGPYLFGPLSLADLALVPTAVRLGRHRWRLEKYDRVARWMEQLLNRPWVRAWMEEADTLPPVWFDEYLQPGEHVEHLAAKQP